MKITNTFSIKQCLPVSILLSFFLFKPLFPQDTNQPVNFLYSNTSLESSLESLIEKYRLSIVYLDHQVQGKIINSECVDCSGDEALTKLLEGTSLIWVKNGDQYIIQALTDVLPNGYEIGGYVRDKSSKEFIPFANVFIKNSYIGDITNESGYFSLINVMADICTLTVSYIGYKPENEIIRWADVKDNLIHIELEPRVISTAGITVKGEYLEYMDQTSEPNRISFSPRHINSLPKLGETDLFRSLQLLPGVLVGNAGSAGLYIRGGTPDQNLILLDGISIYQTDHFFGFYSSINASAVKDIQVYKGGYPAKYGGRVSSVITMTGKTGNTDLTKYNLNLNLLSTGISIEQPLFGRGSIFLSARSSYSDYYKTKLYDKIYNFLISGEGLNIGSESGNPEEYKSTYTPDFSFQDFNGKIMFLPTEQDIFSISYYQGQDNLVEFRNYIFIEKENETFTTGSENIDTDWGNEGAGLLWSRRWKFPLYSKINISQSIYESKSLFNSHWVGPEGDFIDYSTLGINKIKDNSFRFDNEFSFSNSHNFNFGIQVKKFNTEYNETNEYIIYLVENLDTTYLPLGQPVDQEMRGSLSSFYFMDQWKWKNIFIFDFGLRVSEYNKTSEKYFEPRFSFNFTKGNFYKITGHVGRYHQFMHRFSNDYISNGSRFVWMLSNDNLMPILSDHYSLGIQYVKPGISMSTVLYYRTYENLADFSSLDTPNYTYDDSLNLVRFGSGKVKGYEILLHKKSGFINGWASYNYTQVNHLFPEQNGGYDFLAEFDRAHEFKCVAISSLGPWSLTASWVVSSGRVITPTDSLYIDFDENDKLILVSRPSSKNSDQLQLLDRLDISVSYRVSLSSFSCEVGLSIYNIFNRKNISHRRYVFFKDNGEDKIIPTDVTTLGITPTLYIQFNN